MRFADAVPHRDAFRKARRVTLALGSTVIALTVMVSVSPARPALAQGDIGGASRTAASVRGVDKLLVTLERPSGTAPLQVVRAAQAAGTKMRAAQALDEGSTFTVRLAERLSGAALERAIAELAAEPGIATVEPDRRLYPTLTPNDPYFPDQWNMRPAVVNSYGSNAAAAWDLSTGSSSVVVAVVDTGVDASHPDLSPTLADGSPRVLPGTSFLPGTELDALPGTTDPSGHGTHVAGVVAAARNGVGTVGLAPGAQILPVRVIAPDGTGWSSAVAAAVRWSHDQGADVINLSLGSTGPLPQMLSDAVDYATSDTSGGRRPSVVVAAAGNSGTSGAPVWPAVLPRVVAVGATDAVDRVTSFSTRGSWIDVAAPGVDVLSTCAGGAWCALSGTSTAAPAVAATAALLRQQDPGRSPAAVQNQLESSAKDLGLPGKDVEYGAGLVRPAAALGLADVSAVPAPAPPGAPADVQTSCLPTACLVTFRTVGESVWGTFVAARTGPAGPPAALAGGPSSPVVLAGLAPGTGYALVLTSGGPGGIGASTAVLVRTPGLPSTAGRSKVARRGRTARRAAVRRR